MARIKCTFDYEDDNKDILQTKAKINGISIGKMLNVLTRVILGSNRELKQVLAETVHNYIINMEENVVNRFSVSSYYKDIKDAEILLNLLTDGKGLVLSDEADMERYDLDKISVIVPSDWILITPCENYMDCEYVGVVATDNTSIFDFKVPNFVFFSPVPINVLTDEDIKNINSYCIKCFRNFKSVLNNVIDPIYDKKNKIINYEIYMKSPKVGYFQLHEYLYDVKNPGNAQVFRK